MGFADTTSDYHHASQLSYIMFLMELKQFWSDYAGNKAMLLVSNIQLLPCFRVFFYFAV